MVMDANWQAVVLDIVMITELILIGVWFSGNLLRWPFAIMSIAFVGMGASLSVLLFGDLMIALNVIDDGTWYRSREWRALPWRYGFTLGLATIAGVLRFGRFNGR